ncbi:CPBP family intramembrane glutamic endopeptidase [Halobacillus litoralis]|uniref:CPBP family intramembrane glutamic endopeptidase n=1 Tax=Halobacillus litoralis TaxID=45668 RepID=UPI00249292E4|nr:CPBP family intramembrane glutamic endopeptidase [Halobacillus litoralis]
MWKITTGHPFSFFSAFLMSILFSIAYLKTGKIYVPMILHSFGNILALMNEHYLSPMLMESEDIQSLPTQMDLIVIIIIAAILLIAMVFGLAKLYPREKGYHL